MCTLYTLTYTLTRECTQQLLEVQCTLSNIYLKRITFSIMMMMMMAFITLKSNLVPLFEGLWISNSWEFELSGISRNRTDDLGFDSPSLWPTEPRLHVRSKVIWKCFTYLLWVSVYCMLRHCIHVLYFEVYCICVLYLEVYCICVLYLNVLRLCTVSWSVLHLCTVSKCIASVYCMLRHCICVLYFEVYCICVLYLEVHCICVLYLNVLHLCTTCWGTASM